MLRFLMFTAIAFSLISCIPDAIQLTYTVDLFERTMLSFRMLTHVTLAALVFSIYE